LSDHDFAALLMPGESLSWFGKPASSTGRSVTKIYLCAMGAIFLGLSVWAFWTALNFDTSSENSFHEPEGSIPPVFVGFLFLALAGFLTWLAISGKGILPLPVYGLSDQRAFIREHRRGQPETIARFVEQGRALHVVERGIYREISIPVRPEDPRDQGFVTFEKLSMDDFKQVLTRVNELIGAPNN
jgi:hypothetical protein